MHACIWSQDIEECSISIHTLLGSSGIYINYGGLQGQKIIKVMYGWYQYIYTCTTCTKLVTQKSYSKAHNFYNLMHGFA